MADTYRETEEWLERCKQNHGSKYNSGWDDLHWEKEIKKAEEKLARWGKQLKLEFPAE
jgi:hypothetical protein